MKPIVYLGNLMLSGVVSGSNQSTDNVVRKVADGSINLPYTIGADVSPSLHSGSVTLTLTSAQEPTTFILPKCQIPSGHTLILQSMDDPDGTNTVDEITLVISGLTTFVLQDLPGSTSGNVVWRVLASGASGVTPAKIHEIQLATTKTQFASSPQVLVDRDHVRQFTRSPIPGGQPFTKRDGPLLRQYAMTFIAVSGADNNAFRNFALEVEGGGAFTLTDDLAASYWAELPEPILSESDSAGVSTWRLVFQEIKVD